MGELNRSFFDALHSLAGVNAWFDDTMVFLAAYLPYGLSIGFFVLIFRDSKSWRRRLAFFSEALIAIIASRALIVEAVRFLYPVARPFLVLNFTPLLEETSPAFPSGHASVFFALATTIFIWNRRWGTWFFILAVLNGFARVVAGVHWPLDILGGLLVGILGAVLVHWLLRHHLKELRGGAA